MLGSALQSIMVCTSEYYGLYFRVFGSVLQGVMVCISGCCGLAGQKQFKLTEIIINGKHWGSLTVY